MTQDDVPTPLAQVVGRAVKDARKRASLSQEGLADRMWKAGIGWSRNQVANLESGRMARLDLREVLALAAALGLSPLELIAPAGAGRIRVTEGIEGEAPDVRAWVAGAVATMTKSRGPEGRRGGGRMRRVAELNAIIEQATAEQRALLGVPEVEHGDDQ